ncbi:hypothetical protein PV327_001714 [Microctonus hyperodae]|uniref:SEA domain-containing protein n=1 Tax=Microctonus hyperodae TaxID=165561 RepID=A0AA39KNE7_MICHY|nr:hypothetical protein PV327_001714 [Microctonus hyperodae]
MWRPKMHSDVHVLQNILWIFFMCSTIIHTQQDEIKTTWNNRLYPTNSVYEVSSGSQTSSVQSPLLKDDEIIGEATDIDNSQKTDENPGESEDEYDDDYESEDIGESSKYTRDTMNHGNTHYETKDGDFTEEYDSELVYDDYDNETNSQEPSAEIIDYALSDESLSHESMRGMGNSSVVPERSMEESEHNKELEVAEEEEEEEEEVEEREKDEEKEERNEKKSDEEDGKNEGKSESKEKNIDEEILIGEAVVSVVTTKSVVNGTFAVPTQSPMTTEQMLLPPTDILNTTTQSSIELSSTSDVSNVDSTEDSIIVASVQTSRSISGAHYLPFNLNNEDRNTNTSNANDTINKTLPLESTESIIDKLDRVQSELSSGFLTGGFRTAGNALQLDVLSEQRPTSTRKTFTTTGKPPVISKFIPRRSNNRKSLISTTESASIESSEISQMMNDQAPTERSKNLLKIPWPNSQRARSSTSNSSNRQTKIVVTTTRKTPVVQDIRAFLPAGFKLKESETTEKSILSDILARSKVNLSSLLPSNYKISNIEKQKDESVKSTTEVSNNPLLEKLFAKSNVDISALLPPDFNKRQHIEGTKINTVTSTTFTSTATTTIATTTPSTPIQKTLQELFSKSSVDIAALLPPGYQGMKDSTETQKSEGDSMTGTTSKTPGGIKLVFPSRPGGRKAIPKAAIQQNRAADMFVTPKIQKGWPTRTTTEFTGWPTPSTTPISIEKLLEAARTATVSSLDSSIVPITTAATTTSTSTTTSTTMRPTTPGLCEDECEVAGTIRIVGNTTWVPELLDRNTREWQQLANEIEKEMNLVFLKSAILRKWYKNVRIDAFSQGSILVDYFIELQELTQKVNTQELKVLFHDSLRAYNAHRWNETKVKGPMRLGEFVIDPKSTDFVVIPKINLPQSIEKDDRLIPQWAIAVIVIGVGGLLFIIVFGVSVLVNRQNASKLKPPISGMYGEEAVKNIIHSNHVSASHRSSQDYPKSEISTIWNETDAWREKSFESNSNKILVDGMLPDERKYNVYDSWRSEWNGYYNQPSHTSSKFAGYESTAGFSRHPPDYDTNF